MESDDREGLLTLQRQVNEALVLSLLQTDAAEAELRHQDAVLRAHLREAVIRTDTRLTVQSWNKAAHLIYGWSEREALGRPLCDVLQCDDVVRVVLHRVPDATLGIANYGITVTRKDRGPVIIDGTTIWLCDADGSESGYLFVHHDVTESTSAEQLRAFDSRELAASYRRLQERGHSKARLLSAVSYEMRSDLTPLLGLTDLMLFDAEGTNRELLEAALRSSSKILETVKALELLADVEAGSALLCLDWITPTALTVEAIEHKLGTVELTVRSDFAGTVYSDARFFRQLVDCLLDEAASLTWTRRVAIHLRQVREIHLELRLSDGVDEAMQAGELDAPRQPFRALRLSSHMAIRLAEALGGSLLLTHSDRATWALTLTLPIEYDAADMPGRPAVI